MNDIFEQIDNEYKEFIEKWKTELEKMKRETPDDMRKFTITYKGKTEHWYLSDEEMTHDVAMAFIEKAGKRAPMFYELITPDDRGKTRLQLLHEAGADGWAWCKDSPFGCSDRAFLANLSDGAVLYYDRNGDGLFICHD